MKTHRCQKSLEAKVSIRYTFQYEGSNITGDFKAWRLFKSIYDADWDSYYNEPIANIKYCPFCGQKLEEEN